MVEPRAQAATRPDFRLTLPRSRADPSTVLVEATVVGDPAKTRGKDAMVDQIADHINEIQSDSFFVIFQIRVHGTAAPRSSILKANVEQWLATLDRDAVARDRASGGTGPSIQTSVGDWTFDFTAIPASADSPESRDPLISNLAGSARRKRGWAVQRDLSECP